MNLNEVEEKIINIKLMLQSLIDADIISIDMAERIAPVIIEQTLKGNFIDGIYEV